MKHFFRVGLATLAAAAMPMFAQANGSGNGNGSASNSCASLPSQADLKQALENAVEDEESGLDFEMWATMVDRDGVVCAVAFSGDDRGAQWPGSRVISAQKANAANAFSLDGLALSTANLYAAVQPGGSLFGLQESNPVDTTVAYKGPSKNYGTKNDPMVGEKIGGVNVFGGGLALYSASNKVVGGVGVSGDTSCADHMIGWRVRHELGLDNFGATVGGVSAVFMIDADRPDNIIYDLDDAMPTGFGHPTCLNTGDETTLPAVN